MSWIYRSSSLLRLNTTPLRDMNRDHQDVLPEDGPSEGDRLNIAKKQLGIYGNKMTSQEKRSIILRRLVWLTLALMVLVLAIVLRVNFTLPEEKSTMFSAGNMTELWINSTNTWNVTPSQALSKKGFAKSTKASYQKLLLLKRSIRLGMHGTTNSSPCSVFYYLDLAFFKIQQPTLNLNWDCLRRSTNN